MKVMISYDMREGKEQACQEYLVNKMAPGLAKLGFRVSDVWYTVWGNSPQITSGDEVDNAERARSIFLSREWQEIAAGMQELTTNFKVRMVRSSDDPPN